MQHIQPGSGLGGKPVSIGLTGSGLNIKAWTQMIDDPKFREKVLNQVAIDQSCESILRANSNISKEIIRRFMINILSKLTLWMGFNPKEFKKFLKHRKKGAFMQNAHRKRGLTRD